MKRTNRVRVARRVGLLTCIRRWGVSRRGQNGSRQERCQDARRAELEPIASADRHTIKPWFTSRLPESPPIVDLGAAGFTLLGGRLDVLNQMPAATVVYRHGGHTVSLTALRGGPPLSSTEIAGYNVVSWHEGEFTYVAVADLPESDLEAFKRAFLAGLSS